MTDHVEKRTSAEIAGTILARVVVPVYILGGATMKYISMEPEKLPGWIKGLVQQYANPEIEYNVLIGLLTAILCVEVIGSGLMIFISRLSRIVGVLILAIFSFVLIAEITHRTKNSVDGILSVAFAGDCGCFGSALPIPPGVMMLIDLSLMTSLIFLRPIETTLGKTPKWAWAALIIWAIAGVTTAMNPPETIQGDDWTKWQPRSWIGKHYSETYLAELLPPTTNPVVLGGGKQIWILYNKSCHVCHDLFLNEYQEVPEGYEIVVAVHIPRDTHGIADPEEEKEVECWHCEFTEIKPGTDWKVSTPTIIVIDEYGVITSTSDPNLDAAGKTSGDL